MKDLYQRLNLPEQASETEVAGALAAAHAATRQAAEHILLDPQRRAVYDRNRRLLVTIGTLRAHLGLNLKPFWSRGGFRDFSYPFGPGQPRPQPHFPKDQYPDLYPRRRWRVVDPAMMVSRAFGVRTARTGPPPRDSRRTALVMALIAFLLLLALIAVAVGYLRG